jgi:hypothetical protein
MQPCGARWEVFESRGQAAYAPVSNGTGATAVDIPVRHSQLTCTHPLATIPVCGFRATPDKVSRSERRICIALWRSKPHVTGVSGVDP